MLARGGAAVLSQTGADGIGTAGVVVGLGGVGKSQLAAAYARRLMASGELDVLVWVSAATRAAIISAYAAATQQLLGAAAPDDPVQAAAALVGWLEPAAGRPVCRWLVVLDDVTDPDHLTGLWPPPSPTGRTLVTTRRRDHALLNGRHLVPVGVFTPAMSRAYLAGALAPYRLATPGGDLDALAVDLGHLPLALAQAAAYIGERAIVGMTVAGYRRLLADRTTALRDTAPERLPDGQPLTVAATWSLAIEHADTLHPAGLARPMLHLAAMLDPNGIPATVLTSTPARLYLACHRTSQDNPPAPPAKRRGWLARLTHRPTGTPAPEEDALAALSALHRLGLITHTPGTPTAAIRVHQLVQRATLDTLTPDQQHSLTSTAAQALLDAWPDIERNNTLATVLRANTTALEHAAGNAFDLPDFRVVLFQSGSSLGEAGQVAGAVEYFQRLTNAMAHYLGPNHPDTLVTRHQLAHLQGQAGDVSGAVVAFEALLEDMLRVLGPDHLDTLNTRHELAYCRGQTGDVSGAVAALAALLKDRLRVQGPDNPDTLGTRHNLASWRGQAGDASGAAAAFAALLNDMLRVHGPDHPDTLAARHELAARRKQAGDAFGAVNTLADLLEDQLRVLGPDHPYTLVTRHNLASWRGEAGDAFGAAAALAELLEDRRRVLGPDHPYTLTTRRELAYWRRAAGDA